MCIDIYIKPYALYFPGAVIAAACLLIASENINLTKQVTNNALDEPRYGNDILSEIGISNLLLIDYSQDLIQ